MSADGADAGATFYDDELAARYSHLLDPLVAELRAFAWDDVPCPICRERPRELAYVRWGIEVQRCLGCPTLDARIQFDYDNGLTKLRRDVLPFRQDGRFLEIGASNGGLVRRAQEHGFDAIGIEPAADVCELARRTHGVVMHDVLEHLLEPVDELREIHRVLRAGGFLAIETLTASSLDLHEQGIGWSLMSPLCHVNFLDERNGARALREAGFRILDFYSLHEDNWISYAEAA